MGMAMAERESDSTAFSLGKEARIARIEVPGRQGPGGRGCQYHTCWEVPVRRTWPKWLSCSSVSRMTQVTWRRHPGPP